MYKVKKDNPKNLIFRNRGNDAIKLDIIARHNNLPDRAAALHFLLDRECEYLSGFEDPIGSETPAYDFPLPEGNSHLSNG